MTALQRFDASILQRTALLRGAQRRGSPYDAGRVAVRITNLLTPAKVVPFEPRRVAAAAPADRTAETWAAFARARLAAQLEAARAARVEDLERQVADLEAEVRGLRVALDTEESNRAAAVAEAERRVRHELLGDARRTVAGHTMPSIVAGASR